MSSFGGTLGLRSQMGFCASVVRFWLVFTASPAMGFCSNNVLVLFEVSEH